MGNPVPRYSAKLKFQVVLKTLKHEKTEPPQDCRRINSLLGKAWLHHAR